MKNCKHCGAQLADDDTYCYFCGAQLEDEKNETFSNVADSNQTNQIEYINNGFALAGFALAFFMPLLGLIFSIIGLKKAPLFKFQRRGLAIAGIIVAILNYVISFIILFIYIYYEEGGDF